MDGLVNIPHLEIHDLNKIGPPLKIFANWFQEAQETKSMRHPEAFTLATLNPTTPKSRRMPKRNGTDSEFPNTRVVLMKQLTPKGLIFFTNYKSSKGHEIDRCNHATAHFYWDPLFRQVKIVGHVEKISRAATLKYWRVRPRISQISQWVSNQSQPVKNRVQMEVEYKAAEHRFSGKQVPCPNHWGGFILKPTYVEFWIGRNGRFHDRYTYQKVEKKWIGQRLYP